MRFVESHLFPGHPRSSPTNQTSFSADRHLFRRNPCLSRRIRGLSRRNRPLSRRIRHGFCRFSVEKRRSEGKNGVFGTKSAEDWRTPRRFAPFEAQRTPPGFGVRQSSGAFHDRNPRLDLPLRQAYNSIQASHRRPHHTTETYAHKTADQHTSTAQREMIELRIRFWTKRHCRDRGRDYPKHFMGRWSCSHAAQRIARQSS